MNPTPSFEENCCNSIRSALAELAVACKAYIEANQSKDKRIRELEDRLKTVTATPSIQLREALITWRRAEKYHAKSVLEAAHPGHLCKLAEESEVALHAVRTLVDQEPWSNP